MSRLKTAANQLPPVEHSEWEDCSECFGEGHPGCWACHGRGGRSVSLIDCGWCGFETEWPGVEMYDGTRACDDCADANDDYRAGGPHDASWSEAVEPPCLT